MFNTAAVSMRVAMCLMKQVATQGMCQYNWSKYYFNGVHYRGKATNNNNQAYTTCKENVTTILMNKIATLLYENVIIISNLIDPVLQTNDYSRC